MMRSSNLLVFATLLLCQPLFAAQCTVDTGFSPDQTSGWSGWGNGYANTRQGSGLNAANLDSLELQWAFGFPGVGSVIGQPVISDDRLFIGVDSGEVYSLDADRGCVWWTFKAENGVRTAPQIARVNNVWTVYFGDRNAQVYALNARTGRQLWKTRVDDHAAAILTGSPQFVRLENTTQPARLLVPVSSSEEGLGAAPGYPCCSFRGSVVALDAASGAQIWKTHTIEDAPEPTGDNSFGPSGGAIWSVPTVDLANNRFYVTTGDAYSSPADAATDAVLALNLTDGTVNWIFQGTAGDIWTVACMRPDASGDCGPDQDFGSPVIQVSAENRNFLISGQKSGIVRAHDPATGTPIWETALVENTTEFGGKIVWGGASDGSRVYFGMGNGDIAAIELNDGAIAWQKHFPRENAPHPGGFDGPLTLSEGLLFSGGWDGVVRALATENGEVLWQFNTAMPFETVNQVDAQGGSMGAAGPVVADGRLYVPSGYAGVKNGMQGNVLLMFAAQE